MNRVRYYREQKNMSQKQLSKKSGISRPTISAIENNDKYDIKIGTMVAIADALEQKVEDVFFYNEG